MKKSFKLILICFMTGCLEMYDFMIFGFFIDKLNENYFNFLNKDTGLIISYMLLAVGFLFRPLGSILFGYIGDRLGRKHALVISVVIMGMSSLGLAILPTYQSIGITSCYIIAILRIIQGISLGGEYTGSIIFAIEHFKKSYSNFVGSIVFCGYMSGILLAALVNAILTQDYLPDYSWRMAFLLGFTLCCISFLIRKNFQETPIFEAIQKNKVKSAFVQHLKDKSLTLACCTFIVATSSSNFYAISLYLPGYLNKIYGCNLVNLSLLSACVMVVIAPISGLLSLKISRNKIMCTSAAGIIALCILAKLNIFQTININYLLFIYAVLIALYSGPMSTLIVETFNPKIRFLYSGLCFSLGSGVVGGTVPMIASILDKYLDEKSVFVYLAFISLLGLLGMIFISSRKANKSSCHELKIIKGATNLQAQGLKLAS